MNVPCTGTAWRGAFLAAYLLFLVEIVLHTYLLTYDIAYVQRPEDGEHYVGRVSTQHQADR